MVSLPLLLSFTNEKHRVASILPPGDFVLAVHPEWMLCSPIHTLQAWKFEIDSENENLRRLLLRQYFEMMCR